MVWLVKRLVSWCVEVGWGRGGRSGATVSQKPAWVEIIMFSNTVTNFRLILFLLSSLYCLFLCFILPSYYSFTNRSPYTYRNTYHERHERGRCSHRRQLRGAQRHVHRERSGDRGERPIGLAGSTFDVVVPRTLRYLVLY